MDALSKPRQESRIARVTAFLETRKGAFAVARLIMICGVPVRRYDVSTPETPADVQRVLRAVSELLEPDEMAELERSLH
jgi:hypothetical protein